MHLFKFVDIFKAGRVATAAMYRKQFIKLFSKLNWTKFALVYLKDLKQVMEIGNPELGSCRTNH